MSSEYAGRFVAKVPMKKNSKPLIAMGISYKAAAMLAKSRLSNFIVGRIYSR